MNFGNLSFWLWCLAGLVFLFMLLSGYSLLSYLWYLPKLLRSKMMLRTLKPGGSELLREPPKKLTAMQVGKMMLLLVALGGAYDMGIRIDKGRDYATWKAEHQRHQKEYAAWAAKYLQENK